MYKIVYCTDDGKKESTHFMDAKNYGDMCVKVKDLVKDGSVLDIYICRQIGYVNAYMERKTKLSSLYGTVVSK